MRRAAWLHANAPVGNRDPVYNFLVLLSYWGWWQSDDIMTSLLKKLSISIKIHVVKPLWSLVWSVSKLSTESVGSRRELVANFVHTADADATQLDSWVASAVCIGLNKQTDWVVAVIDIRTGIKQRGGDEKDCHQDERKDDFDDQRSSKFNCQWFWLRGVLRTWRLRLLSCRFV